MDLDKLRARGRWLLSRMAAIDRDGNTPGRHDLAGINRLAVRRDVMAAELRRIQRALRVALRG
jgi:hypothetical protein